MDYVSTLSKQMQNDLTIRHMIKIRPLAEAHWAATWQIIEPEFRAGKTVTVLPGNGTSEYHCDNTNPEGREDDRRRR